MRKLTLLAAMAAATALTSPAQAGNPDGKWQVKVLGTAVLPDGKITSVKEDNFGLPAGTQTKANDNIVPTLAVEYFFTPNVSVETICCLTQHDVDATAPAALDGAELVSNAKILPATVTLKYHLDAGPIKPYVGVGPTYFIFIDEKPGAAAIAVLGTSKQKLNDKVGAVLQAGVDVPVGTSGFAVSLDAKKYFLRTTASWYDSDGDLILRTRHKLDPWVLSAGVSYRF